MHKVNLRELKECVDSWVSQDLREIQTMCTNRYRGFHPVCALFTVSSEWIQDVAATLETVKVDSRDCRDDNFPARTHDMISAGAPSWLAHASTTYRKVVEGRGKSKRTYYVFTNLWLANRTIATHKPALEC